MANLGQGFTNLAQSIPIMFQMYQQNQNNLLQRQLLNEQIAGAKVQNAAADEELKSLTFKNTLMANPEKYAEYKKQESISNALANAAGTFAELQALTSPGGILPGPSIAPFENSVPGMSSAIINDLPAGASLDVGSMKLAGIDPLAIAKTQSEIAENSAQAKSYEALATLRGADTAKRHQEAIRLGILTPAEVEFLEAKTAGTEATTDKTVAETGKITAETDAIKSGNTPTARAAKKDAREDYHRLLFEKAQSLIQELDPQRQAKLGVGTIANIDDLQKTILAIQKGVGSMRLRADWAKKDTYSTKLLEELTKIGASYNKSLDDAMLEGMGQGVISPEIDSWGLRNGAALGKSDDGRGWDELTENEKTTVYNLLKDKYE